ncbi:MAG: TetR/AcrR family transcriptional regulator [Myxococcota bacterium]
MARPKTDIQPRILHAARARFLVDGVDGASLRAIARDAATSIGMIYYYYPSKDDLFFGVVEEVYAEVMADLEQALAVDGGFEARIRALYHRIAHMTAVEAEVFRLVVREALVSSERLARLVERFKRGHLGLLVRVVMEGRKEGVLDPSVPLPLAAIATGVLGAAPQILLRALGKDGPFGAMLEPGDGLVDVLLRVLMGGIGR